MLARTPKTALEPVWPLPIAPGYFEAVKAHNEALSALARDCTSCAADYRAANEAFGAALRALPDERMNRDASDTLEMPSHRRR